MKHKKRRMAIVSMFLLIIISIIYNVYDNSRVKVVSEDIIIKNLPESFDGFKILQISDLHGKEFGDKQEKILNIINRIDYDMIAFTGDMNENVNSSEEASKAILDLIDGLDNKNNLYWVDGNTGPFAIEDINGICIGKLTEIGQVIEAAGCQVVNFPMEIQKDNKTLWIVPEMSDIMFKMKYEQITEDMVGGKENYDVIQAYYKEMKTWYEKLSSSMEPKILLNHYPYQLNLDEEDWESKGHLKYDLILAGHYHGGQIRIPFWGAVYIPSPTAGILNGYFPKQEEVKGLNYVGDIPQYISGGLGASSSIPFMDFRLFNTPEINVITLRCK